MKFLDFVFVLIRNGMGVTSIRSDSVNIQKKKREVFGLNSCDCVVVSRYGSQLKLNRWVL